MDLLDGFAECLAPQHGVQHVVGDDRRPTAVLAFAGRGVEPLQGRLAVFSRSVSAIAAKNANSGSA
ncbi:hypothetical protein [Streptomyces sp. A012304]|uniref:hypothetical protein n=1 Tax=Streptomyces sp. A012304 TaxID=375446 RepID=UPI00222E566B|nr:hypothetical protein [Streptomyces sp. A012304]